MFNPDAFADFENRSVVATWGDPFVPSFPKGQLWEGRHCEVVQNYKNHPSESDHECRCYIVPPHLRDVIKNTRLQSDQEDVRELAEVQAQQDKAFREVRKTLAKNQNVFQMNIPHVHGTIKARPVQNTNEFASKPYIQKIVRTVYDAKHTENLSPPITV